MDPSYSPVSISQGNKKPLVIFGVIASIIAVIAIVALVIVMNMLPKKSAEEEYNEINEVFSEYFFDTKDATTILKDALDGEYELKEILSQDCLDLLTHYRDRMNDFKTRLSKIEVNNISYKDKQLANEIIVDKAPEFFEIINGSLGELINLIEKFTTKDFDSFLNLINKMGLTSEESNTLVQAYNVKNQIDQNSSCNNDSAPNECQYLYDEYNNVTNNNSIVKTIFQKYIDSNKRELITAFMNRLKDFITSTANKNEDGNSNE